MGAIAYPRSRPLWPSPHDSLLMVSNGQSVARTDSNPLLKLLLGQSAGCCPPPPSTPRTARKASTTWARYWSRRWCWPLVRVW